MSLTRRRFVEAASLTLLASAARPISFAQSISGAADEPFSAENVASLEGVSEETFKPFIGESFSVHQGNRKLETLTLRSVTSAPEAKSESKLPTAGRTLKPAEQVVKSFSLRFRTSGTSLPQGTYILKNERMGSLSLFIVPGGPKMDPRTYTATFSLLAP